MLVLSILCIFMYLGILLLIIVHFNTDQVYTLGIYTSYNDKKTTATSTVGYVL